MDGSHIKDDQLSQYRSKEFRDLHAEWKHKLETNGFKDIEDRDGNLKSPDTRTIAYQNSDIILEFFLMLDHFMAYYKDMPKREREIMSRYSQGITLIQIAKEVKVARCTVIRTIERYKGIILTVQRINEMRRFP